MSVTYVMVGDCRKLQDLKHVTKENILKKISDNWNKQYFDLKPDIEQKSTSYLESYFAKPCMVSAIPKTRILHAKDVDITEGTEIQIANTVLNLLDQRDQFDANEQ